MANWVFIAGLTLLILEWGSASNNVEEKGFRAELVRRMSIYHGVYLQHDLRSNRFDESHEQFENKRMSPVLNRKQQQPIYRFSDRKTIAHAIDKPLRKRHYFFKKEHSGKKNLQNELLQAFTDIKQSAYTELGTNAFRQSENKDIIVDEPYAGKIILQGNLLQTFSETKQIPVSTTDLVHFRRSDTTNMIPEKCADEALQSNLLQAFADTKQISDAHTYRNNFRRSDETNMIPEKCADEALHSNLLQTFPDIKPISDDNTYLNDFRRSDETNMIPEKCADEALQNNLLQAFPDIKLIPNSNTDRNNFRQSDATNMIPEKCADEALQSNLLQAFPDNKLIPNSNTDRNDFRRSDATNMIPEKCADETLQSNLLQTFTDIKPISDAHTYRNNFRQSDETNMIPEKCADEALHSNLLQTFPDIKPISDDNTYLNDFRRSDETNMIPEKCADEALQNNLLQAFPDIKLIPNSNTGRNNFRRSDATNMIPEKCADEALQSNLLQAFPDIKLIPNSNTDRNDFRRSDATNMIPEKCADEALQSNLLQTFTDIKPISDAHTYRNNFRRSDETNMIPEKCADEALQGNLLQSFPDIKLIPNSNTDRNDFRQSDATNIIPKTMYSGKNELLYRDIIDLDAGGNAAEKQVKSVQSRIGKTEYIKSGLSYPEKELMIKNMSSVPTVIRYIVDGKDQNLESQHNIKETSLHNRRPSRENMLKYFMHWHTLIKEYTSKLRHQIPSDMKEVSLTASILKIGSDDFLLNSFWPFQHDIVEKNQMLALFGFTGKLYRNQLKTHFYEILYGMYSLPVAEEKVLLNFNDPNIAVLLNRSRLLSGSESFIEKGEYKYSAEDKNIVTNKINAAMKLINNTSPELYRAINQLITCIAIYKSERADRIGGSSSALPGVIYMMPIPNKHDWPVPFYAEQIVHEFIHNMLYLEELVVGTYSNYTILSNAEVISTIRGIPRNYDLSFHAAYVSTGLAVFHSRAGYHARAGYWASPLKQATKALVDVNKQYGVLTMEGEAMLQTLVDFVNLMKLGSIKL